MAYRCLDESAGDGEPGQPPIGPPSRNRACTEPAPGLYLPGKSARMHLSHMAAACRTTLRAIQTFLISVRQETNSLCLYAPRYEASNQPPSRNPVHRTVILENRIRIFSDVKRSLGTPLQEDRSRLCLLPPTLAQYHCWPAS